MERHLRPEAPLVLMRSLVDPFMQDSMLALPGSAA